MFDVVVAGSTPPCAPTLNDVEQALIDLAHLDAAAEPEATQIDLIATLERLKGATAAAQARITDNLARARTTREAARGVPAAKRCRGLASEIGLARRSSPHRGARDLGLAKALVRELPHTLDLLTRGEISEWRATIVARETAVLSVEHRAQVDAELADQLPQLGDAEADTAPSDPQPNSEPRTRDQVMADTLTERITGHAHATDISVEIQLVMTDSTLLADDHTPAHLIGYGPIHATLARDIVHGASRAWLRRLHARPGTSDLVAMDSRRRTFTGELRHFLVIRDQTCRTPWCDAPIRHADHITPAADGGKTSARNGQGLCETCNYTKQATDWHAMPLPGHRQQALITTPTGHTHLSSAPDPPWSHTQPRDDTVALLARFHSEPSPLEDRLRLLLT